MTMLKIIGFQMEKSEMEMYDSFQAFCEDYEGSDDLLLRVRCIRYLGEDVYVLVHEMPDCGSEWFLLEDDKISPLMAIPDLVNKNDPIPEIVIDTLRYGTPHKKTSKKTKK